MDKENVGIDYEYRCRCLEEEILDIERELNKEIEWLKKVISSI